MPSFSRIAQDAFRFAADRGGNVATLFAVSAIPLLACIGFAVDYSSALRVKTNLQNSLDVAVLAGAQASAQNNPDPAGVVRTYVNSAFKTLGLTPTVVVNVGASGVIAASARVSVPNYFMQIVGNPTMDVTATSQVDGGGGKLELALAFDTTYSMTGAKLAAAQSAANNLIDTVFALPNAATNVKVGLVPFSYYVNVGTTYAGAPWLTSTAPVTVTNNQTVTTCATPATYATTLTPAVCTRDGTPYDCSYYAQLTPAGSCSTATVPVTQTFTWNGCVGSRNYPLDLNDNVALTDPVPALVTDAATHSWSYYCNDALQRLTSNPTAMKATISAMVANGETYIAPGLLWAWRLLSPNAPFGDGAAYGSVKKAIVLMTDGFNTHSPYYPDHEDTNTTLANQITAQTCAAVKAAGVTIFAIAFEVTDPSIQGILQSCATQASYYYDASTIVALNNAFTSVGMQLTSLRLTK